MAAPVSEASYRSFLVRLWRAEGSGAQAAWQGEVAHIQSGAQWRFASVPELLAFLGRQADDAALPPYPPGAPARDPDRAASPPPEGGYP